MPDYDDEENNHPIKLSITEQNKKSLPEFIKFDIGSSILTFNPAINTKPGIYKVSIILKDSMEASWTY